jgi:hypothetical protein
MATKYSQIPQNSIFTAAGGTYRKIDDLYYEDLNTGFQTVWSPIFDNTIVSKWDKDEEPTGEVNTKDKFLVDQRSRLMQPNPNYQSHQSCVAERTFAEMWGTAEYDCGPEEYEYMAMVSVPAVGAMKALGQVVGMDGSAIVCFPGIVDILTVAYEEYKNNHAEPEYEEYTKTEPEVDSFKAIKKVKKPSAKKAVKPIKKTPTKKSPAKKAAKKKAKQ